MGFQNLPMLDRGHRSRNQPWERAHDEAEEAPEDEAEY